MQYALLIYETPGVFDALPGDEQAAAHRVYMELSQDARCVGGAQLQAISTATSVRVREGSMLTTDGPFAATKEVFGGYCVFDCADLDAALEVAGRIPAGG
jgi:hypothetical protein